MHLLNKNEILESYASTDPDSLFIEPLLDTNQIGSFTIDLRLGYDFLVSVMTRKPSIELHPSDTFDTHQPIRTFFQETRRDMGERFLLHPHQVVLTTTLEYVSLPNDCYADVLSRSSYTRLGLSVNTMIQPGYHGCISLELFNHGNSPIELIVGSKVCQIRIFKNETGASYFAESNSRKYFGNVRPVISAAEVDEDLQRLNQMRSRM
ncbi:MULTISPECIES: dCTP deaminase [Aeromonas]|jgi:dCTP deaminase|uniref:dCTP deaminase n=1 Tax=Aeromonas TaxID=642 RepID=UPI00209ECCB1|nr:MULTISPECIES: dCTP deaminase [Aeromonas]MCP1268044.1 dCTP deaminase [Aeromonas hydrophila]MCP1295889.1 dCTP deaminase [Aeromonas hydrophila]MCY9823459.1 dCTP deaminase [Aeromonas media]